MLLLRGMNLQNLEGRHTYPYQHSSQGICYILIDFTGQPLARVT